jgi:hypothetical protein
MFSAGIRRKFDEHWELTASWKGTFGKKFTRHIGSIGVGYNF